MHFFASAISSDICFDFVVLTRLRFFGLSNSLMSEIFRFRCSALLIEPVKKSCWGGCDDWISVQRLPTRVSNDAANSIASSYPIIDEDAAAFVIVIMVLDQVSRPKVEYVDSSQVSRLRVMWSDSRPGEPTHQRPGRPGEFIYKKRKQQNAVWSLLIQQPIVYTKVILGNSFTFATL